MNHKGSSKCFSPILESCYRVREHSLLDPRTFHASETLFLLPRRVPIPRQSPRLPISQPPHSCCKPLLSISQFFLPLKDPPLFPSHSVPKLLTPQPATLSHISNMSALLSNLTSSILFPLTEELVPNVNGPLFGCQL